MTGATLRGAGALVLMMAALLPAATAHAGPPVTRYASQNGTGPQPCTDQSNPCNFVTATTGTGTSGIHDGDTVIVLPGTYTVNSIVDILADADIHGQPGAAMPVINMTTTPYGVIIDTTGAKLTGLQINDPTGEPLVNRGGTADRIIATTSQPSYFACVLQDGTLRDSVCWSQGTNGVGVGDNVSTASPLTPTLRNVTAIAPATGGVGLSYEAQIGTDLTADALNVIARGAANDVESNVNSGVESVIHLDYSNYATTHVQGAGASITAAGSAHNQMAAPSFANSATGDFSEATGSPTINAGTGAPDLGALDLAGASRTSGSAPDIGAYEVQQPAGPAAPAKVKKCKRHKKKHGRAAAAKKRCKKRKHH